MSMNQSEIEGAARSQHACPNVRKGVKLLLALMQSVNDQSDGWPYWKAPGQSAKKLMDLLKTAGNLPYGTHGTITAKQLKDAVTPIRRMVTTQREKQKRFGNSFDFDVDAALGIKIVPPVVLQNVRLKNGGITVNDLLTLTEGKPGLRDIPLNLCVQEVESGGTVITEVSVVPNVDGEPGGEINLFLAPKMQEKIDAALVA